VNNAGGSEFKSLMDTTPDEVVTGFALNTFGPLYLAQTVVGMGKMPHGGRIINIGTVASKLGITGMGVYGAAKAATDSLTESLAQELGRTHGITVNTVAPGPVKTDITINAEVDLGMDVTEPLRARARGSDRLADPEDIADVVAWVASDKARWITAQFISASAGINGTS
jgi:NAD(P)-dependent dehydrogenase (short-subunit alcohol dehydrogenase family)